MRTEGRKNSPVRFFVPIFTPKTVKKMKVVLLVTGRTDTRWWNEALNDYTGRLKHYIPFEVEVIPDLKHVKNRTETQQKMQEGALIVKYLQAGDFCVLLDERGKEFTSRQFALYMEKKVRTTARRLVFVIGGAYGFSDDVYAKADERIALGKMTFSHQMIRPVFAEQLYRAMTIIRGEPYHHE
jgi:23S rRNA (pseudouridine1915-N3)-methyltransferase